MEILALLEGYLEKVPDYKSDEQKPPEIAHVCGINLYTKDELRWYFDIKTVEAQDGKLVAVIPVNGFLSPSWYGGTNTEWLKTQLSVAADNALVHAIVLNIESPGGTVSNTLSTAKAILETRKKMPVIGYTQTMAASSAYWLYSHCEECFLENKTYSSVGSIGTIVSMFSQDEYNKKNGFEYRIIRSKGSEDKALGNPNEPINEDAVAEMQALADSLRVEFLNSVLAVRPKVDAKITGKMYYGSAAISAGLADTIGDLNAALKRADYLARKR